MDKNEFGLTQEQAESWEAYKKYVDAETNEEKLSALREMKVDAMMEQDACGDCDNTENYDDEDPDDPPVKDLTLRRI